MIRERIRRLADRDGRGAAMLEFAVVAPVVILLMLGMADLALVSAGNNAGGNGAREGARYGIINFDCADAYAGSTTYNSATCTTTPSANYTAIVNVVTTRISGLVKNGTIAVAIRCIDGSTTSLTSKSCTKAGIVSDQDLIEVKVTWTSLGASPYAATSHTDLARLMIQGVPATTNASATTTTAAPTTTTTVASTTTTTAAPVPGISAVEMYDNDHDGKVDQVKAVFTTATINTSCNSSWSAANVPSAGTVNTAGITVTTGTNTVTIPINEGAGAADTSVGSFTITFTPGAGCNATSFGPVTPTDLAPPVAITITSANVGSTAGLMQATDTLTITFSEPVTGVAATTSATETDNGSSDYLNITGITNGNNASGGDYVSNNKTASFASSTVALSNSNKTVTVTIAGSCTNDCNKLQVAGPGNLTFVPATTIKDVPGNAAVANVAVPNVNLRLF